MDKLKNKVVNLINNTENKKYVVILPTVDDINNLQIHVVENCDFFNTTSRVLAIIPDSEWNMGFSLDGIILYNDAMKPEAALEKLKSNAPIETFNG